MSVLANRPMVSSPRTSHFWVSQLGRQLWLMNLPRPPCSAMEAWADQLVGRERTIVCIKAAEQQRQARECRLAWPGRMNCRALNTKTKDFQQLLARRSVADGGGAP